MQYVGWFLILICLHVIINGHPNATDWTIFVIAIIMVVAPHLKHFRSKE
jgi:hypothetical protein